MEPYADLILANRAYLDHQSPKDDASTPRADSGGLLAAVRPAIQPWDGARGTTWIGSGRGPFDAQYVDDRGFEFLPTRQGPLRHRRLFFDTAAWNGHYNEVANSFFWPLLHLVREPLSERTSYYPRPAVPSAAAWGAYEQVNLRFAACAVEEQPRTAWVHDYQLALVPRFIREAGFRGRIGFFLHTPFPDAAVVETVGGAPARNGLEVFLRGILGADLVGLQCEADVSRLLAAAHMLPGAKVAGDRVTLEGHTSRVAAHPVGIDPEEILSAATMGDIPSAAREVVGEGLPLVVGLERSDFTKGIPERLRAVARAFEGGARFGYAGLAAPTREGVPAYRPLEDAIAEAANGARLAADAGPGRFLHLRQAIAWNEVVALQRQADVVFTSSVADGMNLVPLQSAIAQSLRPAAERGTVIVGRDSGVASVFHDFEDDGLVIVDPLDDAALDTVLHEAVSGQLPRISDRLIAEVRRRDARHWAQSFLADLESCPC